MDKDFEFKVGDIVEAFGVRGQITGISKHDLYPVVVEFATLNKELWFTKEGLYQQWHATPSLKFISREEKKIPIAKNDLARAWDEHLVGVAVSASDFSPSFKKILLCLGFKD